MTCAGGLEIWPGVEVLDMWPGVEVKDIRPGVEVKDIWPGVEAKDFGEREASLLARSLWPG